MPLGIDFTGGTLAVVEFAAGRRHRGAGTAAVSVLPGDEVVQRYGAAAERQFLIRLPLASSGATAWRRRFAQIAQALQRRRAARVHVREARAGQCDDRQRFAAPRHLRSGRLAGRHRDLYRHPFRLAFAVGAIAATVHDVLVTLACLSLAGYDLSLNVVAALLTIIGYSVNDTIVIFDRVRENASGCLPKDSTRWST